MAEVWATIAAAAVVAGGTAYAANKNASAQEKAAASLGGAHTVHLDQLPPPQTVDTKGLLSGVTGQNLSNLPAAFNLAGQVNRFNVGQFKRGANSIQPYFNALQEQIGRNAMSYSKGELPADVVSSIGRAAAQRGFQNGLAGGAMGGGQGTALGSLNLRNLGLTSLDLSQRGTALGMQANQQAANMVPGLFDVSSQMMSPGLALSAQFQNAGILNNWNAQNTQIANAEATGNTELLNSILQQQGNNQYAASLAQSQAVQSGAQSVAGLLAKYGQQQSYTPAATGGSTGAFSGASAGATAGATSPYLV